MNIIKPLLIVVVFALTALTNSLVYAQGDNIPEPLKPWVDWVLHDKDEISCPYSYNSSKKLCVWPSRLKLDLSNNGGKFSQQWQVFADVFIVLPGSVKHWPLNVNVNGKEALVQSSGNTPYLKLAKGKHTVTGEFKWSKLPKSLAVMPSSGLINLNINNTPIARPSFNANGQLWLLQSNNDKVSEDNIGLQVFRRVSDGHPIEVETFLKLRVSGKQRNANLDSPLLDNFIATQITSDLPARLEGDGQLKVQLRPGEWSIRITGRAPTDLTTFTMPELKDPWPNQEVWVFENDNNMRQVQVTGATSIDPNQTSLPNNWKHLPAYVLTAKESLKLEVSERGITNLKRNELNLTRDMWLDFDGNGYSIKDTIYGSFEDSRLNVLPSIELGRVSINDQPQFITRETNTDITGIEIRHKTLDLTAESRYTASNSLLPANGWEVDLQKVDTTLHLPPGWQVLAVTGADNLPYTWLEQWTLLDLFLVIIIIMSIRHFFGWRWAVLACFTLVLTWQETGAPKFIWLNLLAITALLSVLHKHKLSHLLEKYRWATLATLAVIMLAYMIDTMRVSLYPQLDRGYTQNWQSAKELSSSYSKINQTRRPQKTRVENDLAVEEIVVTGTRATLDSSIVQKRVASSIVDGLGGKSTSDQNLQQIDPNSIIQSGPGLPSWNSYRSISMTWTGPVKSDQQSKIFLLGPKANFIFRLLGIILLLCLIYCFVAGRIMNDNDDSTPEPDSNSKSLFSWIKSLKNTSAVLAMCLLLPLFSPEPTNAQSFPDTQMLDTLEERLTADPDCLEMFNQCAQIEKLLVNINSSSMQIRLRVHAAIATAIPLPASQDTWIPKQILINGNPASAIARNENQTLWLSIDSGLHDIVMTGPVLKRASFPLPLPLKPNYSSWSSEDDSWNIEGINEDGISGNQIQFIRVINEGNKDSFESDTNILPTFVKVERQLRLGLDWYVNTTVRRISPKGVPLNINIPLLENEKILDAQRQVKNKQVALNFSANQNQISWTSQLKVQNDINLVASNNQNYLEVWSIDASPIWRVKTKGLPVNRFIKRSDPKNRGKQIEIPVWQPWPNETLALTVSRPEGVEGQSLTIQNSLLSVSSGKRVNNVTLRLSARSSRGVKHQIKLPTNADVQELDIDNVKQRVQVENNLLSLSLKPGQQDIIIKWREPNSAKLKYNFPEIDLLLPSVNAHSNIQVANDRWVIWANGPLLGPAVLFWSVLSVLLLVSIALGWSNKTPLNALQWFLLAVGLSQTSPALIVVVFVCLISLSVREKLTRELTRFQFNFMQLGLIALCIISVFIMVGAVANGLLGRPDMQITGNGSNSYVLKWYQDRVASVLPQPGIISVPILVYRALMLLWAMWLAMSLLKWIKWGWQALTTGEFWIKKPKSEPKPEFEID